MRGDKSPFTIDVDVDDITGKPRAVYFHVRRGEVAETREIESGRVFADYDQNGSLIGVELLAPCLVTVLDRITDQEPQNIKTFLRSTAPRELVCN